PEAGVRVERASQRDEDHVYDAALEGLRVLAVRDGDESAVILFEGTGAPRAVSAYYPEVVRALRALPVLRVVLDGTLGAFDASGRPRLSLLARRAAQITKGEELGAVTRTPVVLVAQDLLALGDADTRTLPLSARRELLTTLMPGPGFLRASPPLVGDL